MLLVRVFSLLGALLGLGLPTGSVAATTDLGLSPFQAQTAWVSPHRDMQNTDFVPFATAVHYAVKWRAEIANTTLWAPSMGPEGNLYICTGRAGDPNVHAYDRAGNLIWETGLPVAGSAPNPVSAAQLPFVDVDGDVYLSDNEFFWAFHSDGTLKWRTALPAHPAGPPAFIGAPVVTSVGYLGGITNRGQVLFYDRATGVQVVPTFELPGGPAPAGKPTPGGLWAGGELAASFVDVFWAGFNGFDLEVSNTPAIHSDMDRLFITSTSSATNTVGALYALDLVAGQWQIAFETPLGVNSGTSPALSPDGRQVYAVGGDNALTAYDAMTGGLLWTVPGTSSLASPQVGPDGTVYTGTDLGDEILAVHQDGTLRWRRNYDFLARQMLGNVVSFGSILTTGRPVARADSVATVTGNNIKVVLKLGYDFRPPGGAVNTVPKIVVLATLCPIDGQLLDWVELPDDSRGLISVAADGGIFTSHAAAFTSIFYYSANIFVPLAARVSGPPAAGVTALEPVSFLEQTTAGLIWARALAAQAIAALSVGHGAAALPWVKRGGVQLGASADSFADAEVNGELSSAEATARSGNARNARAHFEAARSALTNDPLTAANRQAATAELAAARLDVETALEALPCDDGVACTSGDTFAAGECRGRSETGLSKVKLRVTLKDGATSATKDRISLKATLRLADLPTNPDETGMVLDLTNGGGKKFYRGEVPATAFVDKKGTDRKFQFSDPDGLVEEANGLVKVQVKRNPRRDEVLVDAKIKGAETVGADGQQVLSVSLLFGGDATVDVCAATFMRCRAKPGKTTSCSLTQ